MWDDADVSAYPANLLADHSEGYPRLDMIPPGDPFFSIYRRFRHLNYRVPLKLLREIWELEEELGHEHDEGIHIGGQSRNDLGQRARCRILDDLRKKLEEYDEIMTEASHRSSSFPHHESLFINYFCEDREWNRSYSLSPHDYAHFQPDAFPRHRRGRRRGKRHTCEDSVEEFFSTEMFVRDRSGGPQIPAIGRQDSLCAVPLICSSRWIREMNQESAVTRDVKCPGTTSITGHEVSFQGVVRNMVFTLKGLTFRRDVWVCDQLDGLYDFVFGASFIKQNFRLLFQKMFQGAKNIFAGWFTKRKETPEEKREAEALRAKQESEADILEKARQARQAEEREKRKQASIHETNASSL